MININLLPPESKEKINQAKQSAGVFGVCLVVLFLTGVIWFIGGWAQTNLLEPNWQEANKNLEKEKTKINSYKEIEAEAVFINNRAQIVQKIEAKNAAWSQILQDLLDSMPAEVQFESIAASIVKTPNFVLQGSTNSETEMIKFKDKLDSSPFFKNVFFKTFSTNDQKDGSNRIKFSFNFDLENYNLANINKERK